MVLGFGLGTGFIGPEPADLSAGLAGMSPDVRWSAPSALSPHNEKRRLSAPLRFKGMTRLERLQGLARLSGQPVDLLNCAICCVM